MGLDFSRALLGWEESSLWWRECPKEGGRAQQPKRRGVQSRAGARPLPTQLLSRNSLPGPAPGHWVEHLWGWREGLGGGSSWAGEALGCRRILPFSLVGCGGPAWCWEWGAGLREGVSQVG